MSFEKDFYETYLIRMKNLEANKAFAEFNILQIENSLQRASKRKDVTKSYLPQLEEDLEEEKAKLKAVIKEMKAAKNYMNSLKKKLSVQHQNVFYLRYFKGLKIKAIASKLNYSGIRIKQMNREIYHKLNVKDYTKVIPKKDKKVEKEETLVL